MKPVYFPITFISKPVCQTLAACFRQIVVYQISSSKIPDEMQLWGESGILDIRIPVKYDGDKLEAVIKQYRSWATSHQGSEIAFLKSKADEIPFFDEDSTRQITADIKSKGDRQNRSQKKSDPLLNAGLFLHLAQEYDIQNLILNQDLQAIEVFEQDFMRDLKGENQVPGEETVVKKTLGTHDPGHYMTKERIHAWSRLMQQDRQDSGLFVTTSASVFESLLDSTPEAELVVILDGIPVVAKQSDALETWKDELMKHLETIMVRAWPVPTDTINTAPQEPECELTAVLSLYIVPGKTPLGFFSGYAENDSLDVKDKNKGTKFKNTLLGLIQKNS